MIERGQARDSRCGRGAPACHNKNAYLILSCAKITNSDRRRWIGDYGCDVPDVPPSLAHVGGRLATHLRDLTTDVAALDSRGFWVVVADFEGYISCARFGQVRTGGLPRGHGTWTGPARGSWTSSLDRLAYLARVQTVRERIAAGQVYQVNLCRILRAPMPVDGDLVDLAHRLAKQHPSPYAAFVRLPNRQVVCASPELFLRREGAMVQSSPIKGTGRTTADLLPKDNAENVMIVDLVRNDLGRVAATGTVDVSSLLRVEQHPGLVHLVSTVRARLNSGVGWADLFAATFPPGSVSGAPKSSALRIINQLEPVPRGPYCGAIGWVDADRHVGELAVGIRTFWATEGLLHFGTGAGITWGSDAPREWEETRLKAHRLIGLASGRAVVAAPSRQANIA
jgi:para-aminobenzoate synthetase component I